MALHHNPRIVTSGLVLALDAADTNSYPGSGTTWYDLSGNGNHFTLYNTPIFSDGYFDFNGTNEYARSTNTLDLSPYDSVSVEVTFRANTTSTPTGMLFEHSSNWNNQTMGFGLVPNTVSSTNYVYNSHHTNQYYGAGATNYDGVIGLDITTHTNIWSRVSDSNGRLAYINSTERTIGDSSTSEYPSFRDDYFFIASRNGQSVWYNVKVYSLKIYGSKLSSQEIQQNYNATKTRFQ